MLEKLFHNADLDVELTSYIDDKQNMWFKGKDIFLILRYKDTRHALKRHVDSNDKILHLASSVGVDVSPPQQNDPRGK